MKKLLILGSTAPEIVKALLATKKAAHGEIEILGFLDDDPQRWGVEFMGFPVLGGSELLTSKYRDAYVVNNVAKTMAVRKKVWQKLKSLSARCYTTVHPSVDQLGVEIGEGTFVQEGCIFGPGVTIGRHSALSFGVTIAHESTIGDVCFLSPGAILNGRVTVREGAFLGAGCIIFPYVTVGEWSIVGAGSVVTTDVPPHSTMFGSPARVIAQRTSEADGSRPESADERRD